MKPSSLLLVVVALTVVLLLVVAALRRRGAATGDDAPWPYYARRVLSQPEQVLYHRLVAALPGRIVLAQVQVSRVLGVKKGVEFHPWNNRINRLSYDFVVCTPDGAVQAAIELDDSSHDDAGRAEVDARKDRATAAAGVRMVRWHVKSLPDEAAIRRELGQEALADATPRAAIGRRK